MNWNQLQYVLTIAQEKNNNKGSSEGLPFPAFSLNEPEKSGGRTWCRNF